MLHILVQNNRTFEELKEIEKFLQEANTLEELYIRSALTEVPNHMYAVINNEPYYFLDGKWHKKDAFFSMGETK